MSNTTTTEATVWQLAQLLEEMGCDNITASATGAGEEITCVAPSAFDYRLARNSQGGWNEYVDGEQTGTYDDLESVRKAWMQGYEGH